jgi:hypothetical protein
MKKLISEHRGNHRYVKISELGAGTYGKIM